MVTLEKISDLERLKKPKVLENKKKLQEKTDFEMPEDLKSFRNQILMQKSKYQKEKNKLLTVGNEFPEYDEKIGAIVREFEETNVFGCFQKLKEEYYQI